MNLFLSTGCLLIGLAAGAAGTADVPHVRPAMRQADFWIQRHPDPDGLVLDAAGLKAMNRRTREAGLTVDVGSMPAPSGADLRLRMEEEARGQEGVPRYDRRGQAVGEGVFVLLRAAMDLEAIPDRIRPRYAVVVHAAHQRILPTEEVMTAQPGDLAFDELQNTSLDIGTPLAVLHTSRDGQWLYTQGPASHGWVRADRVALCFPAQLRRWLARPFVVAVSPLVVLSAPSQERIGVLHMGSRLPLVKRRGLQTEVVMPLRGVDGRLTEGRAYAATADVHSGFLPYTVRHVLEQAFKMLDHPYGWGGMNDGQDCSGFIQAVFATVGLELPRNSWEQGQSGTPVGAMSMESPDADKAAALRLALPGASVARMKGHIVLYLGQVDGRPYAIHATHGYRRKADGGEETVVLDRVVVSDFSLGEGSQKGSLLRRVVTVRELR